MDKMTMMQLVFGVLGGLALFIYGMQVMSNALSLAMGDRIRILIAKTTKNRVLGTALGGMLGFLIQSSASTVLFVGFINAGLMTFLQSIAPMLGVNIGTTLSIQLISFKLSDYTLAALFLGLLLSIISKKKVLKHAGMALLGFGLLFLGMTLMSDAIRPHRALFEPWLQSINGHTMSGLILGTLVSALITGIIQSSGAMIGMGFAMVSAGAITDLHGIFPIIIGANIGTCVTGLLGSIGTTIEARRAAISHLLFNIFSTSISLAAAPLFFKYIPFTSGDVIHQAANANSIKMLLSALIILPVIPLFEKVVIFLTPSKKKQPEPCYLDHALLKCPEVAIVACLQELQRSAKICAESLHLVGAEFTHHKTSHRHQIKTNEQTLNMVKLTQRDYIIQLTHQSLSQRQSILIEHIDRCMSDLERIGDHIDNLSDITQRQRSIAAASFTPELINDWLAIHSSSEKLLEKVIESLNPETPKFEEIAKEVLFLRERFAETARSAQQSHFKRLEEKRITPIAGIIFNDYLANFWRMTKHIKSIALAEQQPHFWLKQENLQVKSTTPKTKGSTYLDTLQSNQQD